MRTTRPRAQLREGRTDWYRIENLAGSDTATIHVYDEIGYWGVTASDFIAELKQVDTSHIDLHVNSPGGEVFDGFAIFEALRTHRASVTTHIDSLAASIASVIAMAGDRIVMGKYAELMIHDALGVCIGNAADMRAMVEDLDRESDRIAAVYAERAGGTAKQWRGRMQAETWFSAQEAVEAGLADEIAKPATREEDQPPTPPTDRWDLSVFAYSSRKAAPAPDVAPAERPEPPAPAPAAPQASADPEPALPAEEPLPEVVFDPDAFRAAAAAAADPMPGYDPEHLRSLMAGLAQDAPAPQGPAPAAPAPNPGPPTPAAPEPPAPAHEVMADYFRTVMADVARDAPAPAQPTIPDEAPAEPDFPTIDRSTFERSLREARL